MDVAERVAVKRLVGGGVFVRLAEADDALLVSDAPRRMDTSTLAAAVTHLRMEGYAAWVTERGLLAIDWAERRWRALDEQGQTCGEPTLPGDETLHPLYALYRLLAAHPAPWHEQPRTLLRALVKASARKDGLVKAASAMLAACAERLRRHEALPSAAAWLIVQTLEKPMDGTEALT